MSEQSKKLTQARFFWKGKRVTEKVYKKRCLNQQLGKNFKNIYGTKRGSCNLKKDNLQNDGNCQFIELEGRRIIDLKTLKDQLICGKCEDILSLEDVISEKRYGLASVFSVKCRKCKTICKVNTEKKHMVCKNTTHDTSKQNCCNSEEHKHFDINTKSAIVSALNAEAIANGLSANISDFPFEAAILGTLDLQFAGTLLCSAVMVSSLWLLSIAHCFMGNSEQVKPLIFIAIMGSDEITVGGGAFEYIESIYTEGYDHLYFTNDITMAKVMKAFALGHTVNLINTPTLKESFSGRDGKVAGFGRFQFGFQTDRIGNTMLVLRNSDLILRYTNVTFSESRNCFSDFPHVYSHDKFCGVAVHIEGNYTGMCWDDAGSPLVIDNKVVGLSCRNQHNCNDTNNGSLYIAVADYFNFISNILLGTPKKSYKSHVLRNPNNNFA